MLCCTLLYCQRICEHSETTGKRPCRWPGQNTAVSTMSGSRTMSKSMYLYTVPRQSSRLRIQSSCCTNPSMATLASTALHSIIPFLKLCSVSMGTNTSKHRIARASEPQVASSPDWLCVSSLSAKTPQCWASCTQNNPWPHQTATTTGRPDAGRLHHIRSGRAVVMNEMKLSRTCNSNQSIPMLWPVRTHRHRHSDIRPCRHACA